MRDLFGIPLIDRIVWTLEIEIRFYLVCALMHRWIRAGKLWHIVALAVIGAGVTGLVSTNTDSLTLLSLSASWQFITLMFVGTIFAFLYRGLIGRRIAVIAMLVLLAAFYGELIRKPARVRKFAGRTCSDGVEEQAWSNGKVGMSGVSAL
jgi:peptidoglycan/LPS O-acetylase OafA/YrhL